MRDYFTENIKRACSGIQNRFKYRTPLCYTRDSSKFIRKSNYVRMKMKTKYADRRPVRKKNSRKAKLLKPRHLVQKDRFVTIDNLIENKSSQIFDYVATPVYGSFVKPKKRKLRPAKAKTYEWQYIASDEKPKKKDEKQEVKAAKPVDLGKLVEKEHLKAA